MRLRGTISQRTLDKLRREWQKRLGLLDWKISSKFIENKEDIPEHFADAVAWNECLPEAKESRINIIRLNLLDEGNQERGSDVEDSLVHELLHCYFEQFWGETNNNAMLKEQAIEALTRALLELKREND